ncbi:MAG: Trk system potassium transporter TrkA [Atribacterota bacterium]|nr:Trk system potassium transporter TrkA [Candidatus Atribacteria bacterium]MDD5497601.1 Trk system potassium transporter TrkA [Atribacterota bacterium]
MKVIIIGAGKVGIQIAQTLSAENHDVTIIDKRDDIRQDLDSNLDIMTIVGNGANVRILEQAGIRESDMLIAVTRIDEVNMIACMTAKQFNVTKTIARIRNTEYMYSNSLSKEKLGIDFVINPERATAKEIVKLLKTPSNVCEAQDFASGKISLFGLKIEEDCPFVNKKIKNISFGAHTLIIAIFRGDNLIIPSGEDEILVNDKIYLLIKKENYTDLELFCPKKTSIMQSVIILGGSDIGIQTASFLNKLSIKTKLIEMNKQKCEKIAELLPQTLVINGDGTNIELLKEEGIETIDGFVAVTGYDEENLLVSLLAKHLGTKKVIAKISRTNYIPILEKIGINAVVNPRIITASAILRFLKQGELISQTLLKEGEAEVIELIAQKGSKIINKNLKTISLPANSIIGAIIRKGEIIIPHGEDFINEGDKVIIFTKITEIKKIEQLFY